jgi:hypothetical protein
MSNYPQAGNFSKWDTNTKEFVYTIQAPIDIKTQEYRFPSMFWEDLGTTFDRGLKDSNTPSRIWTWNLTEGELLLDAKVVSGMVYAGQGAYIVADGKTFEQCMDFRVRAIDIVTGSVAWTSDQLTDYPWEFGIYHQAFSWGPNGGAGGTQIYIPVWDGYVYCYDAATGKRLWRAFTTNNTESGMGHNVPWATMLLADDKLYFSTGEHTAPTPLPRGGQLYCVNAETGERIWTMDDFWGLGSSFSMQGGGISSGMMWYSNKYDGCVYMFGKGETATTVSVQQDVIANGASVLIKGTVTDQSPGAKDTPAVSDDSQATWMGYLYQNKPMPTNATGVPVTLLAMRSDGTPIDIAHVTSDSMGHYEYTWTPPDQDTYKVLAVFEGSDSYYTSSAQTALGVTAAAPTPEPPQAAPDNTSYVIGTGIAIIIAVAIVGVLLLRKRP